MGIISSPIRAKVEDQAQNMRTRTGGLDSFLVTGPWISVQGLRLLTLELNMLFSN